MRKALFLMSLVAGVAAMPLTAAAQDTDRGTHQRGGGGHRGGGGGGGSRGQNQQQAQPQQAQPQQQQAQPQVQQQAAPQQRSEWRGDRNNPRMEAARQRYERLERENARNYGTPAQAREVVQRQRAERQDDRGGWQGNNRGRDNDNRGGWNGNRDNDNRGGWNGNRNDSNRGNWNNGRNDNRPNWNGRGDNRGGWNNGRGGRGNWNRNWRSDGRYDWQRYRNSNRFVFHIQPYYAPYRGWSYSRFGVGMFLDQLLFGRNYWISDPWTYRLPPAEPGLVWVRYYNDVLLVDEYTGEVVDVIYDFFW